MYSQMIVACEVGSEGAPLHAETWAGQIQPIGNPIDRHGQIVGPLGSNTYLIIDVDGCLFTAYKYGIFHPGEKDAFGRTRFTADPEEIQAQTNELLKKSSIQRAIRIVARHANRDATKRDGLDIWNIPLKLCVGLDQPNKISYQLVSYLESSPLRRRRLERAVGILKTRNPKQYKVLLACYFGTTPQSWIARSWGISRQAVNELYLRGIQYLDNWVENE